MSYKERFYELCEDVEMELMYRFGILEEELKIVEDYFRVKHGAEESGGIAYKHAIKKIEKIKEVMEEVVL